MRLVNELAKNDGRRLEDQDDDIDQGKSQKEKVKSGNSKFKIQNSKFCK